MNIKGCHKLAPKAWCLSHLRDRGDTINLVNEYDQETDTTMW